MNKIYLIIILIILIIGAGFFYNYFQNIQNKKSVEFDGFILETKIDSPNLPSEILEKYKDEAKKLEAQILLKKIKDMSNEEKNSQFSVLFRLGMVRKMLEDYQGAASAWLRAAAIAPENSAPMANLANLYAYFLKDYPKAEEAYLRVIDIFPTAENYRRLADFYRYFAPEKKNRIEETIFQGLKVLPDDINLLSYLATYYRDTGQREKAIEYFEKILEIDSEHPGVKEELENLRH